MAIAATLRAAGVMAIAVPALVAINQLAREQPVGVVVWNYDRDVAPLFDVPDEVFDASNEAQGARGRS